jgi:CBS domain-containing protein
MTDQPKLVRDLMTVGVPTCKTGSTVREIARFLLDKDVEAVVVLDGDGQAVGVVGYPELIQTYGWEDVQSLKAEMIMSEAIVEVPPDIPLTAAAEIMRDKGARIAYLLHNANGVIYPAAYISYRHLVRHMAAESDEELKDLGTAAQRKTPIETFIEKRDEARRKAGL